MKFENIIKNTSSFIAAVVVYLMAAGMYLSAKGFIIDGNGDIVLNAVAQDIAAPEPKKIEVNYVLPDGPSMGDEKAPVTIYEYSSFGCSHCADFHLSTLQQIKEKYIDKGLVRLVFVPFPIDKSSMDAALLAECVDKDKYMAFAEVLFKKQREWGFARDPQKVLKQYAALSGVSPENADACLHNDENARQILENRQNGMTQLGIQGTPSFIIAANGEREMLPGAPSLERLDEIFAQKLDNK